MNYEEKYKSALEWMRSIYPTMQGADKEDAEHYFPELRESEDERIRKEIIAYLDVQDAISNRKDQDFKSWIAWLEKQGEKINPYSGISFEYNGHIWGMCARDNGVDILCDSQLIKHIENQGEQNPANEVGNYDHKKVLQTTINEQNPTDKIDPKFKVGDCITNDYVTWKVIDIELLDYILQSQNGDIINDTISYVDKHLHLWTIQDANDGDVLVAKIDEEPNDFIYIFKEYDQNLGFWSHCYLDAYINKFHEGIYHNNYNIGVPATKEQYDILFSKMKEAGYEWDAEKKELRKIEQKPDYCHHEVDLSNCSEEYRKAYYDGWNNCNQQHEQLKAEQKPAWSEEDERHIKRIVERLEDIRKSKEDNIDVASVILSEINWLKSLKPRWKPSEEQMSMLLAVLNDSNNITSESVQIALKSLYNDLKNL